MSLIEQIPGVGPYLPYVTLAMAIASLLAAAMPPPTTTSGSVYVTVYNLVHLAAANVGNAKAASAPQGNPK
jgi:hypothetical protein